ncbi:MAG: HlyD family efflux transporter periplasmic adaptor subunit, partial [Bacteroidota bacterium]
ASIFASRLLSSKKEDTPKEATSPKERIPSLRTIKVKNQSYQVPISITGKLQAPNKVEVFAEVGGILRKTNPTFKEGNRFARGAVMINIDSEEARLNILSLKSTLLNGITRMMPDMKQDYPDAFLGWKKYLDEFDINKPLKAFPKALSDQEKYYVISNNIHNQFYTIKSQESRLRKYQIYAPFSGVVSESNINPGALVRVGQKLGALIDAYTYELEASARLKDISFLNVGDKVQLYSDDLSGNWTGTIQRISSSLDEATQSLKVFIRVNGNRLKEGMFMRAKVASNQSENCMKIPRQTLLKDNQVFLIDGGKLKLKQVRVVRNIDNDVLVQGLLDDDLLVNETS